MTSGVLVDPDALWRAAAQLDAAAALLESTVRAQASWLAPPAAGSDEVSQLAARYFSVAARSQERDTAAVVAELRETAAVLRREADDYTGTDAAAGSALGTAAGSALGTAAGVIR